MTGRLISEVGAGLLIFVFLYSLKMETLAPKRAGGYLSRIVFYDL